MTSEILTWVLLVVVGFVAGWVVARLKRRAGLLLAQGDVLDRWGSQFATTRLRGETDPEYRRRLLDRLSRPRRG